MSNAVYHKGYDERDPIEVRIEKDMIEIISHTGPDRSVTLEGLRTFKVRSRRHSNCRIGEFLKELHLTEGRNTRFKKNLDALQKNGSPLPEFETDENHDYFIICFFVHSDFYNDQNVIENDPESENVKDNVIDGSEELRNNFGRNMAKIRGKSFPDTTENLRHTFSSIKCNGRRNGSTNRFIKKKY